MNNANKLGYYISILTAILTTGTFAIAIFTPPLSGPLCSNLCIQYPFLDIASRFPRDYYWMYPAITLSISYLILLSCIYHTSPSDKKLYGLIALVLGTTGSALLITDYFIQISVIQPSVLNVEKDGLALFSQYNPHGIFIALEEIGYLLMSFASLFIAFVYSGRKLFAAIRWTNLIAFFATLLGLVLISSQYGILREYRFEIAAITFNWLGLIITSILLAVHFKKVNL
jgi:hypothetical protein